eukprot:362807-Chlamydomonas_euryale.AAC.11
MVLHNRPSLSFSDDIDEDRFPRALFCHDRRSVSDPPPRLPHDSPPTTKTFACIKPRRYGLCGRAGERTRAFGRKPLSQEKCVAAPSEQPGDAGWCLFFGPPATSVEDKWRSMLVLFYLSSTRIQTG